MGHKRRHWKRKKTAELRCKIYVAHDLDQHFKDKDVTVKSVKGILVSRGKSFREDSFCKRQDHCQFQ
ncbi:hypothetical protein Y1Q_0018344 [Alligator mississippiensis]|uniref:Uncharacterized protein n=1 Tax=Alligator mississippiensis TaxID=8496 RepID=A0A151PC96_ALLMI|nr:hypothetical protein Y1Q_0018344 [Alligator mississippiensis]